MARQHEQRMRRALTYPLLFLVIVSLGYLATAAPQGAEVIFNSTGSAGSSSPDNRTDDGGTITTMVLNTVQQDQAWKGYVGNITGRLTLNDADGFTIYDWDFGSTTITGEVYASRADTPDFSVVQCANSTTVGSEEFFHNMTGSDADGIANTFNYTLHDAFTVGSDGGAPHNIGQDSCSSTATYVNSTRQSMTQANETQFQEILLQDAASNMLFVTIIEDDYQAYREDGTTHDFQMILPESDIKSFATTYYFFLEIN